MLTNQKSPTRWWRNGAVLVMRNGYDGKYKLNIRGLRGQPLYDEGAAPEFQSEIQTALNNAHFTINCGVMETKEERDG